MAYVCCLPQPRPPLPPHVLRPALPRGLGGGQWRGQPCFHVSAWPPYVSQPLLACWQLLVMKGVHTFAFALCWACWPPCHHVWLLRRYSHEMRTLFDAAFRGDADVRISCPAALSGLKCTAAVAPVLPLHAAHHHAILDVLLLCRCVSPSLALTWRGSTPAQPGRQASAACTGWRVLSPGWPTAMEVRPCMWL